jgi:hypothetical protein
LLSTECTGFKPEKRRRNLHELRGECQIAMKFTGNPTAVAVQKGTWLGSSFWCIKFRGS